MNHTTTSAGQPDLDLDALHAPAAALNRYAILDVLRRVLPRRGLVLEVPRGTGEHAMHFANAMPDLAWQFNDPDERARRSIAAHASIAGLANVHSPIALDATRLPWPIVRADAVVAINLIHIAPWQATTGLMAGAGGALPEGGALCLYGPFREGGAHTAASNAAFDADLRARDPAWGVRAVEAVAAEGLVHGLHLTERVAMPANNLSLVLRKGA